MSTIFLKYKRKKKKRQNNFDERNRIFKLQICMISKQTLLFSMEKDLKLHFQTLNFKINFF